MPPSKRTILLTIGLLARLSLKHAFEYEKQASSTMSRKIIKEICRKPPAHWVGDGFNVFPVFADKAFTSELSPFLMFDYAAPKHFSPTRQQKGVGQHPHRGFETVTVAFQGEVEHADSQGNRDVIGPGDVQWMTAARGIVHQEFHSTEFSKSGGIFEMCQLWVNLPAKHKMGKPRYQPILSSNIPKRGLMSDSCDASKTGGNDSDTSQLKNGHARIIAGSYYGTKGAAKTFTEVNMWDISLLNTRKEFIFDIPASHNTIVFVRRGKVDVQGRELGLADVAIMKREGTKLTLQAKEENTSVLILSGEPIDEPIAARGPFVMNTQQELSNAIRDYQMGRNGF